MRFARTGDAPSDRRFHEWHVSAHTGVCRRLSHRALPAVRTFLPLITPGGSYTFINGPLAFNALFPGTGLVSIATAGQAMLARVVMRETQHMPVRVNEVIVHTPFGWDDKNPASAALAREDVARYVVYLASDRGSAIDAQTVHLNSREPLQALEAA